MEKYSVPFWLIQSKINDVNAIKFGRKTKLRPKFASPQFLDYSPALSIYGRLLTKTNLFTTNSYFVLLSPPVGGLALPPAYFFTRRLFAVVFFILVDALAAQWVNATISPSATRLRYCAVLALRCLET